MRAIIVGAGICGLATAIALKRVSIDCVVLEKSSSLAAEGAGIIVWNNGLQARARLGLGTDQREIFASVHALRLVTAGGRRLGVIPVSRLANDFGPGAAMVYRPELTALLARNVSPDGLQFGSEVIAVDESSAPMGFGQRRRKSSECRTPDYAVRKTSLLLGDAAHASAPQLGQGASLALEDAVVFADCLRRNPWSKAGENLVRLRLERARLIVTKSQSVADLYHVTHPVRVWLRNAAVRCSPSALLLREASWAANVSLPALS